MVLPSLSIWTRAFIIYRGEIGKLSDWSALIAWGKSVSASRHAPLFESMKGIFSKFSEIVIIPQLYYTNGLT
jgi:hypothetical protein